MSALTNLTPAQKRLLARIRLWLAWAVVLLLLAAIWSPVGAWWQWLASAALAFFAFTTATEAQETSR